MKYSLRNIPRIKYPNVNVGSKSDTSSFEEDDESDMDVVTSSSSSPSFFHSSSPPFVDTSSPSSADSRITSPESSTGSRPSSSRGRNVPRRRGRPRTCNLIPWSPHFKDLGQKVIISPGPTLRKRKRVPNFSSEDRELLNELVPKYHSKIHPDHVFFAWELVANEFHARTNSTFESRPIEALRSLYYRRSLYSKSIEGSPVSTKSESLPSLACESPKNFEERQERVEITKPLEILVDSSYGEKHFCNEDTEVYTGRSKPQNLSLQMIFPINLRDVDLGTKDPLNLHVQTPCPFWTNEFNKGKKTVVVVRKKALSKTGHRQWRPQGRKMWYNNLPLEILSTPDKPSADEMAWMAFVRHEQELVGPSPLLVKTLPPPPSSATTVTKNVSKEKVGKKKLFASKSVDSPSCSNLSTKKLPPPKASSQPTQKLRKDSQSKNVCKSSPLVLAEATKVYPPIPESGRVNQKASNNASLPIECPPCHMSKVGSSGEVLPVQNTIASVLSNPFVPTTKLALMASRRKQQLPKTSPNSLGILPPLQLPKPVQRLAEDSSAITIVANTKSPKVNAITKIQEKQKNPELPTGSSKARRTVKRVSAEVPLANTPNQTAPESKTLKEIKLFPETKSSSISTPKNVPNSETISTLNTISTMAITACKQLTPAPKELLKTPITASYPISKTNVSNTRTSFSSAKTVIAFPISTPTRNAMDQKEQKLTPQTTTPVPVERMDEEAKRRHEKFLYAQKYLKYLKQADEMRKQAQQVKK